MGGRRAIAFPRGVAGAAGGMGRAAVPRGSDLPVDIRPQGVRLPRDEQPVQGPEGTPVRGSPDDAPYSDTGAGLPGRNEEVPVADGRWTARGVRFAGPRGTQNRLHFHPGGLPALVQVLHQQKAACQKAAGVDHARSVAAASTDQLIFGGFFRL